VTISIVVPAYNEEKLIAATLASIHAAREAFTRIGWASEVIVCDNNSTDRTGDLAREAGATVVFEPVNQIARARNTGARAARGDWLIFVDADSRPSAELFADVAEAIRAGRALAGGTTLAFDQRNREAEFWLHLWNRVSRVMRYAAGSFIFCEAAAFWEIGGFSEALFATEELDLSRRLKRVARKHGRQMVILTRHPMVTSMRKIHLYSHREHLRLLLRTVLSAGGALRRREVCHLWYDGRR
jgi:glycosyltransferase involved in cell wall biosynthesis